MGERTLIFSSAGKRRPPRSRRLASYEAAKRWKRDSARAEDGDADLDDG